MTSRAELDRRLVSASEVIRHAGAIQIRLLLLLLTDERNFEESQKYQSELKLFEQSQSESTQRIQTPAKTDHWSASVV